MSHFEENDLKVKRYNNITFYNYFPQFLPKNRNQLRKKVYKYFHISSRPEGLCKKVVLENFTKFTENHLYQGVFFNIVADHLFL